MLPCSAKARDDLVISFGISKVAALMVYSSCSTGNVYTFPFCMVVVLWSRPLSMNESDGKGSGTRRRKDDDANHEGWLNVLVQKDEPVNLETKQEMSICWNDNERCRKRYMCWIPGICKKPCFLKTSLWNHQIIKSSMEVGFSKCQADYRQYLSNQKDVVRIKENIGNLSNGRPIPGWFNWRVNSQFFNTKKWRKPIAHHNLFSFFTLFISKSFKNREN